MRNISESFSNFNPHAQKGKIMLSCLPLHTINGGLPLPSRQLSHSSAGLKWELRRGFDGIQFREVMRNQAIRVLANPNISPNKKSSRKEVIMVDPLEAKRLAAKQMEQINAKEKLKKRRRIEAINGAWAMIGLTVGLVIEGHTGKSILAQLAAYWAALVGFFLR